MAEVLVVVEPGAGVAVSEVVGWWREDAEVAGVGVPVVRSGAGGVFGPEIVEWIAVPLAVNLVSNALYDLVKGWVARVRAKRSVPDVEVVVSFDDAGNAIVVVRRVEG